MIGRLRLVGSPRSDGMPKGPTVAQKASTNRSASRIGKYPAFLVGTGRGDTLEVIMDQVD